MSVRMPQGGGKQKCLQPQDAALADGWIVPFVIAAKAAIRAPGSRISFVENFSFNLHFNSSISLSSFSLLRNRFRSWLTAL